MTKKKEIEISTRKSKNKKGNKRLTKKVVQSLTKYSLAIIFIGTILMGFLLIWNINQDSMKLQTAKIIIYLSISFASIEIICELLLVIKHKKNFKNDKFKKILIALFSVVTSLLIVIPSSLLLYVINNSINAIALSIKLPLITNTLVSISLTLRLIYISLYIYIIKYKK